MLQVPRKASIRADQSQHRHYQPDREKAQLIVHTRLSEFDFRSTMAVDSRHANVENNRRRLVTTSKGDGFIQNEGFRCAKQSNHVPPSCEQQSSNDHTRKDPSNIGARINPYHKYESKASSQGTQAALTDSTAGSVLRSKSTDSGTSEITNHSETGTYSRMVLRPRGSGGSHTGAETRSSRASTSTEATIARSMSNLSVSDAVEASIKGQEIGEPSKKPPTQSLKKEHSARALLLAQAVQQIDACYFPGDTGHIEEAVLPFPSTIWQRAMLKAILSRVPCCIDSEFRILVQALQDAGEKVAPAQSGRNTSTPVKTPFKSKSAHNSSRKQINRPSGGSSDGGGGGDEEDGNTPPRATPDSKGQRFFHGCMVSRMLTLY